ncbi:MFS transporter [Luteolibacter flavescens]|uniref:MFS transporter n=1 Tax=Luteolibacter flavescens TaxID=1859460 RepID=A0ABT3FU91_9BACT|nr:MFS transporter [Luteolibacter flavescens]MCW1887156.1 MFS transporter [Luteolibacter flavescens]
MNHGAACTGLADTPIDQPRARWAASVLFLVDGIGFGTWAAMIPSVKQKFVLNESGISIVLLAIVVGALFSMSLIGRALSRHGSRTMLTWMAPGYAVSLALLAVAPSFGWLLAAAAVFGAFKGSLDVSVNAQAITVENAGDKPIMATFQALWSIGGLVAALLVGLALKQGIAPMVITLAIAAALLVASFASSGALAGGDAAPVKAKKRGFSLPNGRIMRIGALAFLALFAEGVMMDWSAVYTRTVSGAEAWLAPLAYGMFSGSMAAGRLVGDRVTARFGGLTVLRVSGMLTFIGLLLIISVHQWPVTFLGLGFAGLGLANLVPVLFGAGGRAHEESVGQGVAAVSMIGYFGFLAGPPAIGGLSHWIGLPGAFGVVVVFALLLAVWGPGVLGKASVKSDA